MRTSTRWLATASLLTLAHCGVSSWPEVAKSAEKPPSPLKAPPDKAVVVLVKNNTLRGGGWSSFTVLGDDGNVVAQFPDEQPPGWTSVQLPPGKHAFFLRTFTSRWCRKVVGDFEAGKVYVFGLVYDPPAKIVPGSEPSRWLVPKQDDPAGPLGFHRYVAVDAVAARAMLAAQRDDAAECIKNANDRAATTPPASAGTAEAFESIDFGQ